MCLNYFTDLHTLNFQEWVIIKFYVLQPVYSYLLRLKLTNTVALCSVRCTCFILLTCRALLSTTTTERPIKVGPTSCVYYVSVLYVTSFL